jgi:hypothetical protein
MAITPTAMDPYLTYGFEKSPFSWSARTALASSRTTCLRSLREGRAVVCCCCRIAAAAAAIALTWSGVIDSLLCVTTYSAYLVSHCYHRPVYIFSPPQQDSQVPPVGTFCMRECLYRTMRAYAPPTPAQRPLLPALYCARSSQILLDSTSISERISTPRRM